MKVTNNDIKKDSSVKKAVEIIISTAFLFLSRHQSYLRAGRLFRIFKFLLFASFPLGNAVKKIH